MLDRGYSVPVMWFYRLLAWLVAPSGSSESSYVTQPPVSVTSPVANSGLGLLTGDSWANFSYGQYMSTSLPVYAAVRLRMDALSSVPMIVYRQEIEDGEPVLNPVEPSHPAQVLLDSVNPHWTTPDLLAGTECYMNLFGVAYWQIVSDPLGNPSELWMLRPDRVRVVKDSVEYIRGYVYRTDDGGSVPLLPQEVVRFRYFNPLDEHAGLSPIAPSRLSIVTGQDVTRANRVAIRNGAAPGMVMEVEGNPTQEEVEEFYRRWANRYQGPENVNRPAILAGGMTAKNMGLTPRDAQYLESMRWTLGEAARAFQVPVLLLEELSRATYANVDNARRKFWSDTVVRQLHRIENTIDHQLLVHFPDERLRVQFDLSTVNALQEDENALASRLVSLVSASVMTPNEARQRIGLPSSSQRGADDLKPLVPPSVPVDDDDSDPEPPTFLRRSGSVVDRYAISDRVSASMTRSERRFVRLMNGLFRQQIEAMLTLLDEHSAAFPLRCDSLLRDAHIIGNGAGQYQEPASTGGLDLFDVSAWEQAFIAVGRPVFQAAVQNGGDLATSVFDLGIAFDVERSLTQRWIEDRTQFWAGRVNRTTGQLVTSLIRDANDQGWSNEEIADRLQLIDDFNRRVRAVAVARTETTSSQNQAHIDAYEQAEVPGKQWLTSIDGRERQTHHDANGQVRRLHAMFNVGASMMESPGNGGPAREVVNCRCTSVPVFEID